MGRKLLYALYTIILYSSIPHIYEAFLKVQDYLCRKRAFLLAKDHNHTCLHKKTATISDCRPFRDPAGARLRYFQLRNRVLFLFTPSQPPWQGGVSRVLAPDETKKTATISDCRPFRDPAGARTRDPNIISVVLYLLSYRINARQKSLFLFLVVQM